LGTEVQEVDPIAAADNYMGLIHIFIEIYFMYRSIG
jgi:hypothetical protein